VVQIGQEVTAECIGTLKGMPVMSLRAEQLIRAWDEIFVMQKADGTFSVKILEVNRGGAVCAAFGLKAFLPGSHYLGIPDESLIGTMVEVKFLDVIADEVRLSA
jgi:small subunit ribosomal protein S1